MTKSLTELMEKSIALEISTDKCFAYNILMRKLVAKALASQQSHHGRAVPHLGDYYLQTLVAAISSHMILNAYDFPHTATHIRQRLLVCKGVRALDSLLCTGSVKKDLKKRLGGHLSWLYLTVSDGQKEECLKCEGLYLDQIRTVTAPPLKAEPKRESSNEDPRSFGIPIVFDSITVAAFTEVVGDRNPLHLDEKYAQALGFPTSLVPGMLIAAFLYSLWTQVVWDKQGREIWVDLRFRAAVSCDETVFASFAVAETEVRTDPQLPRYRLLLYSETGDLKAYGTAEL